MRVLVTDDDETTLSIYRAIFGRYPQIDVRFATSVDECKNYTHALKFDLVFMDCDLGSKKENGLDLLKEIKHEDQTAHVFMATSHDDAAFIRKCLKLGASGLIPKSADFIPSIYRAIENDMQAI